MRFRLSTILLAAAIIPAIVFALDSFVVAVWIGHFQLQVNFHYTQDRKITEVAAVSLPDVNHFAEFVRYAPNKLGSQFQHIAWDEGQPFAVDVQCTGKKSNFGREFDYRQHKLLVLRICFVNGEVEFIPVEIPDGRKDRAVTFTLDQREPAAGFGDSATAG